jgi:alpha-tubulin suppressor-like RCC1 family protein
MRSTPKACSVDEGQMGRYGDRLRMTLRRPVVLGGLARLAAVASTITIALAGCAGGTPSAGAPVGRVFDRLALTTTPPPGSNAVAQLALADERSCARMVNGTVKCWGLLHDERVQLSPAVVGNVDDVVDLAVSYDHSCLLEKSGVVRCWGKNDHGELGDGTHNDALFPTGDPGLKGIAEIAVGEHFSCARSTTGVVSCWGKNAHGELADGTTIDRVSPVIAPSLAGVRDLALTRDRGLAVDEIGRILFWGASGSATLTIASPPLTMAPATVIDAPPRVVSIQTSLTHSCVLLSDGTVRCWGSNENGELGDGTELDRSTPAPVIGLDHVVQISVGRGTSCALLADGTAQCWGHNNYGQLGDGTFVSRSLPAPVTKLVRCKQIAIAYGHGCALLDDGDVHCWGANSSGELGDRTQKDREVRGPVLW